MDITIETPIPPIPGDDWSEGVRNVRQGTCDWCRKEGRVTGAYIGDRWFRALHFECWRRQQPTMLVATISVEAVDDEAR